MNASTFLSSPDFEERYYKLSRHLRNADYGHQPAQVIHRMTLWPSWIDFRDGYMGLYEPEEGPPITRFVRVMTNLAFRIEQDYPSVSKFSR